MKYIKTNLMLVVLVHGYTSLQSMDDLDVPDLDEAALAEFMAQVGEQRPLGINAQDFLGQTRLSRAAMNGQIEDVQELLHAPTIDLNLPDNEGRTPLFYAVLTDNVDIVLMLINNGADVNIPDNQGITPLQLARQRRNETIIRILVNHINSRQA